MVDSERAKSVTWSSLWPNRPLDRIRFDIEPDGQGSRLTWSLEVNEPEPDTDNFEQMRHRLNYLINGEMRLSFGR